MSALRLVDVRLTSDELISFIEEAFSLCENSLTREEARALLWLVRGEAAPEDLLIDAPEVLLAMLHGPTMFLPFAHRYLEGQQEARALETLQVRVCVEYAVRF